MKVRIYRSARRHEIEDSEIRAVFESPIVRYSLVARDYPGAQIERMIGDPSGRPFIEIVAERMNDGTFHVFHAILLTPGIANEVFNATGGLIDLSAGATRRQRTPRSKP